MTSKRYFEILEKHKIHRSKPPSDSEIAAMTEEDVESYCRAIENIFGSVFNSKEEQGEKN